jgi:hypothetical protein
MTEDGGLGRSKKDEGSQRAVISYQWFSNQTNEENSSTTESTKVTKEGPISANGRRMEPTGWINGYLDSGYPGGPMTKDGGLGRSKKDEGSQRAVISNQWFSNQTNEENSSTTESTKLTKEGPINAIGRRIKPTGWITG